MRRAGILGRLFLAGSLAVAGCQSAPEKKPEADLGGFLKQTPSLVSADSKSRFLSYVNAPDRFSLSQRMEFQNSLSGSDKEAEDAFIAFYKNHKDVHGTTLGADCLLLMNARMRSTSEALYTAARHMQNDPPLEGRMAIERYGRKMDVETDKAVNSFKQGIRNNDRELIIQGFDRIEALKLETQPYVSAFYDLWTLEKFIELHKGREHFDGPSQQP